MHASLLATFLPSYCFAAAPCTTPATNGLRNRLHHLHLEPALPPAHNSRAPQATLVGAKDESLRIFLLQWSDGAIARTGVVVVYAWGGSSRRQCMSGSSLLDDDLELLLIAPLGTEVDLLHNTPALTYTDLTFAVPQLAEVPPNALFLGSKAVVIGVTLDESLICRDDAPYLLEVPE